MDRMQRILTGLCAALVLAAAPPPAAAQMGGPAAGRSNAEAAVGNPRHGEAVAAAHCASCHGADGNGANPQVPKLAGQQAAYLYRELWAFKRGQRPSPAMAAIVAPLTDAELADVSAFYADQAVRPDPVTNASLAAAGEHVYYGGRPSCAMCHQGDGMPMMGMMGGAPAQYTPRLAGQHALYTLRQLDAFASGQRAGTVMNRIAAALSEPERRAVAEYLAGAR